MVGASTIKIRAWRGVIVSISGVLSESGQTKLVRASKVVEGLSVSSIGVIAVAESTNEGN